MISIANTMIRNYRNHILLVGASLAIAGLFTACNQINKEAAKSTGAKVDSASIFLLQKQKINKSLVFPAELTALERAEIFAKVNGYLKEVKVDIGDHVQKGQLLAAIEAPEMMANYAQAVADVQSLKAKYTASNDAYQRIANAAKVNGTIAAVELEKSRNQMRSDSSAVEAAKAKQNALGQLKDYLIIRAPFNGTVSQRNGDAGVLVGNGNSKPILVIENTAQLRLRLPVEEAYTGAVADSSIIAFTVDAQPDKIYHAKLSRKAGVISQDNRTEIWEYIYTNSSKDLKPGMFANARITLGRPNPSFTVSPSAIATTLEKKFVIRVKQGKAEWVDIRTGMNTGDRIEIFGNLSENDTLLQKATDEIKPGTSQAIKKN